MRRGVTVLVVVVVAAIALAAGIDALRDGSDSEPAAQTEAEPPTVPTPADVEAPALAAADEVRDWLGRVGGTGCLFVTLPGCIIRALRVPSLEFEEEPNVRAPCNFSLDASGGVLANDVSAAPIGEPTAVCEDGGLNVFQDGGFRTRLTNACAPAWMGDGTLTFLRNGGLWHGIEDARQLVSREASGRARRPPVRTRRDRLGRRRALLGGRAFRRELGRGAVDDRPARLLALVHDDDDRRPARERLRHGGRTDRPGVVFFDTGGQRALTFPNGEAVSWAPGELFAAVATPDEMLFVAPLSREVVTLPLAVRDLEWAVP